MIQRIQSLYLTLSIILMAFLLKLPLSTITTDSEQLSFYASGIKENGISILQTTPMLILIITLLTLDIVALFSFKKRILQMRLLSFSIIMKLGSYLLGAFYVLQFKSSEGFTFLPHFSIIFPLVGIILLYLAIRAIGKDEALVKSLDRIR